MKLLVIAAFIAVVSSGQLSDPPKENWEDFPWQTGKEYRYDVSSHTLSRLQEGSSSGFAFKAHFIIRVKSPGHLHAKLQNPQHGQFHQKFSNNMALPADLKYESVKNLDKPIEISIEGGRVQSIKVPSSFSLSNENMLKGLLSALQLDLSTYHHTNSRQNTYDKERHQGIFKKIETDVTGDCETLYSVSPVASEWRRELPKFASDEDPLEITKSRNYGHCHHRVAYHFGVPKGAEWPGTAFKNTKKQFIAHNAVSRFLVGTKGPIYKAETTSTVHVHPHVYGRQKAEVHSYIKFELISVEQDSGVEWEKPESTRQIKTLLFAMSTKQVAIHDQSSSVSSEESHEHINVQYEEAQTPARQSYNRESDNYKYYKAYLQSSSSSDSSAYINDDMPKLNEPAYAAIYMSSESRADKTQSPMDVQKLLLDIAQQLQNPSNMPKSDFLTKFNILVRFIASMSTNALSQTSRKIDISRTSDKIVARDIWMIYRDAVVQSGTPAAFQQIRTWIKNKVLQNEEAAQVISLLAKSLRYPTKEIMTQFFDLALSPEVQEQQFLNSSAIIAATTFIRMGHVNNETAHSYYPTQMYGRFTRRHDRFVLDDVLPRLSEKLKQAVENKEWSKASLYIRAIGNLGHPEILRVFAPYLEGRTKVSTYLRVQMISALRYLVNENHKYARNVLYSIMRNTAEPYEVRVAAVLNLFRVHPTAEMMEVMAQMTNDDPIFNVRAVLKSGIESAADLKDPRYWYLSKSAQAVRHMVTSENLGSQYSSASFFDNYDSSNSEGDSYFYESSNIASKESVIPKHQRFTFRLQNGGWSKKHNFEFSFSSVQDFIDYFKNMLLEPRKSNVEQKYSAKKIIDILKIKRPSQVPLESSFYTDAYDSEKFLSFSEEDLNRLVEDIRQYLKDMEKGVEMHYTKVFNSKQISVMFPIATGVPFIYKYKEPIVIHIKSKANGKIDNEKKNYKDLTANMAQDLHLTVAMNIDGSVGFMDTFSNNLASVGVTKKYQINVPVKISVEIKSGEYKIKVEPLVPDQDTSIAHYSVWPYSAQQMKDSLKPPSLDSTTQVVERTKKVASIDFKFGQQIGNVFHLQGYSYSKSYRNTENLPFGFLDFGELIALQDIALTHFNFRYLGKQSKNKAVTFTAVYDEFYNQKKSGELGPAYNTEDVSVNSASRREDMLKRVSSGFNHGNVRVVDLSATFDGQQKEEFVFTTAIAHSPVDPRSQAIVFFGRNSAQHGKWHATAVAKVERPVISHLNFLEALKKDLKMTYEVDVLYGENSNIFLNGSAERSQKYTNLLREHPLTRRCVHEIENDNHFQSACYKMMVLAHTPDIMKAFVTYKKTSPTYVYWPVQAYSMLNQKDNKIEDYSVEKEAEGSLELKAEAWYLTNGLRLDINTSKGVIRFNNIQIPEFTPYLLSSFAPFGTWSGIEHYRNYETDNRHQPFCTIDGKNIRTFSDRSYKYELSKSWHLVMHQEEQERGKWGDLVILSRRPSEKQLEIYLSLKTETGMDLEIEFGPSAVNNKAEVSVKTKSKKISEGDAITYWDEIAEEPLLQYFTYPDNVLVLDIQHERLRAIYDGERFVISTSEYRKTTRGICGQNTGERRDDYRTPKGLLVDRPEHFAAFYALGGKDSDPQTDKYKKEAQKMAYESKTKYTAIIYSDNEWSQAAEKYYYKNYGYQNVYRTRSYQKYSGKCEVAQQVQYHENLGEICITTTPVASCQSQCHGQNYKVQYAQVVCKPKVDQQFISYKEQIQKGENPQVSGVPKIEQYRVPSSCTP